MLVSIQTRCRYLPPHHIQRLLSITQLARMSQLDGRHREALDLWQESLRRLTILWNSPRETIIARSSETQYSNIFSLFFSYLPGPHFSGVYEIEPPPGSLSLRVTRRLLHRVAARPPLLDISSVKKNIITLYLNSTLAHEAMRDIIGLFQEVNQIVTRLSQVSLSVRSDPVMMDPNLQSTFFSTTASSPSVASLMDPGTFLEFIDSFPYHLTKSQLLDPTISTCIPVPENRQYGKTDIESLFKQLVQWGREDLRSFQTQLFPSSRPADRIWDASRESVTAPGNPSTTQVDVPSRYTPLEHFLATRHPLEAYSFKSEALNILVSALDKFLDVSTFKSRYRDGRSMNRVYELK